MLKQDAMKTYGRKEVFHIGRASVKKAPVVGRFVAEWSYLKHDCTRATLTIMTKASPFPLSTIIT
jgi:hypothetical protein